MTIYALNLLDATFHRFQTIEKKKNCEMFLLNNLNFKLKDFIFDFRKNI